MAKSKTRARLLSLILAATLIMCAVTPALADEPPHWAADVVAELNAVYSDSSTLFTADDTVVTEAAAKTLFAALKTDFSNSANSIFSGSDNAKRGQVCAAVWSMCNGVLALPENVEPKVFTDTENLTDVNSLAALGVVNGRGDGKFYPNDGITNAELAVIIYRTYNKIGGLQVAKDRINGTGNFNSFTGFNDVPPGHWAYEGIMYLQSLGILNGRGDGTYVPEENLTRAELSAVVLRVKNVLNGSSSDAAYTPSQSFVPPSDVSVDDWFYGTAAHALENGYLELDANGSFNPYAIITREEVGFASVRLYMETGQSLSPNTSVLDRFNDGGEVSARYKPEMAYLVSIGMFNGDGLGNLMPQATMSRATLGLFVARVMQGIDTSKMHDYEVAVKEVLGVLPLPSNEAESAGNEEV